MKQVVYHASSHAQRTASLLPGTPVTKHNLTSDPSTRSVMVASGCVWLLLVIGREKAGKPENFARYKTSRLFSPFPGFSRQNSPFLASAKLSLHCASLHDHDQASDDSGRLLKKRQIRSPKVAVGCLGSLQVASTDPTSWSWGVHRPSMTFDDFRKISSNGHAKSRKVIQSHGKSLKVIPGD